eukprot:4354945-Prymnesium_polylepis.1
MCSSASSTAGSVLYPSVPAPPEYGWMPTILMAVLFPECELNTRGQAELWETRAVATSRNARDGHR